MKPRKYKTAEALSKLLKDSPHSSSTWFEALQEIEALEIAKIAAILHEQFESTEESIFKAAELLISTIQLIAKIEAKAYDSLRSELNDQPYTLELYRAEKKYRDNRPIFHRIRKTLQMPQAKILIEKLKSGEPALSPKIMEKMQRNYLLSIGKRRGAGKAKTLNLFKENRTTKKAF